MLETPILFLIFNRPDVTFLVFEKIKQIKPKYLFIAADGPRKTVPGEIEMCEKTRSVVAEIDWNCEVKTLFREDNLGCGLGVSSAISWFFEHVEQGIILEDDCLPDMSFFSFCEKLLDYYKNDESVMHISGDNFQLGKKIGKGSYYFSAYTHIWGWATWKRVWNQYDFNMTDLDAFLADNKKISDYWINVLTATKEKKIDTWDYQYNYLLLKKKGKAILPNINLIKNIGFNAAATHTKKDLMYYNDQAFGEIKNIVHPKDNNINEKADKFTFDTYFIHKDKLSTRLRYYYKKILDKL